MDAQPFAWWIWVALGLLLALGELLTPGGFYLVFFGVGAVVAGLMKLIIPGTPLGLQGLLFVVISVASLMLFRRPLLERFRILRPEIQVDTLIGETAIAMEDIASDAIGKAELRGTSWSARNLGAATIPKGRRCRVERVEGLTLFVEAQ